MTARDRRFGVVCAALLTACGGGGTFVGSHLDGVDTAAPDREQSTPTLVFAVRSAALPDAPGLALTPPVAGFAHLSTAEAVLHAPTLRWRAADGDCAAPDEAVLRADALLDLLRGDGAATGETVSVPAEIAHLCALRLRLDDLRMEGAGEDDVARRLDAASPLLELPIDRAWPVGEAMLTLTVDPAAMLAVWAEAGLDVTMTAELAEALGTAAIEAGFRTGLDVSLDP